MAEQGARQRGQTKPHLVFEATGHYHKALERRLTDKEITFSKVNPWQARRFKEAMGKRVKTDRVDAQMLAMMGQALGLETTQAKSELVELLEEIEVMRDGLIKMQTALKNRQRRLQSKKLVRLIEKHLKALKADIVALNQQADAMIAQDPAMRERFDIICSIPGIGATTARMLLAKMPELGAMGAKEAAALVGIAPITRQSGKWSGKSYIQGGRKHVRHKLFLPAVVACQHNPDMKQFYERLVSAGKPKKVAIIAVMRKLVVLTNALLRKRSKWIKKRHIV